MKLERFDKHEELVASCAESVLRLIEAGRSPDARQAADMLGLPIECLEHQLETRTLLQFVKSCLRKQKRRR
jgi:hypothetical protein